MDAKKQKRNYADEIKSLKQRAEFDTRYMFMRLEQLRVLADTITADNERDMEFIKLFPIRLVAHLESCFRSIVKSLIDHGEPFLKHVPKLNQPNDGKISIELLLSLNESEFTLGELIAHVLPCSKFLEMISALNTLTEKDILKELKEFMPQTIYEHDIRIADAYITNEPLIKSDIFEVYRLRNIFCHELGATEEITPAKVRLLVASMSFFINHLDNYIESLIYPSAPETNADIADAQGEELQQLENQLSQLIIDIQAASEAISSPHYEVALFNNVQQCWEKLRDAHCDLAAYSCLGGYMHSQLYLSEKIFLTGKRIKELSHEFDGVLREYNLLKNKKT